MTRKWDTLTKKERFVNIGNEIHLKGEWWCSARGEFCADVIATALNELLDEHEQLKQRIEKLKERNKNQYEQLDELHTLIENKDWESLSYINKFQKRIDERLQKEEKMFYYEK